MEKQTKHDKQIQRRWTNALLTGMNVRLKAHYLHDCMFLADALRWSD